MHPLGRDRYRIDDGRSQRTAFAIAAGRETWVFLEGRTYVVPSAGAAPARRAAGEEGGTLTAPMPATVLAIHVAPGQRVERNETLMVLEAMKMELPIRAARDGVVKRIGCRVGEIVQPGVTLLEMEGG